MRKGASWWQLCISLAWFSSPQSTPQACQPLSGQGLGPEEPGSAQQLWETSWVSLVQCGFDSPRPRSGLSFAIPSASWECPFSAVQGPRAPLSTLSWLGNTALGMRAALALGVTWASREAPGKGAWQVPGLASSPAVTTGGRGRRPLLRAPAFPHRRPNFQRDLVITQYLSLESSLDIDESRAPAIQEDGWMSA